MPKQASPARPAMLAALGRLQGLAALAWLAAAPLAGAADLSTSALRDVRFAAGQTTAELRGEVKGGAGPSYRVQARAGQTLQVRMTVLANRGLSFNIGPEGAAEAMAIGEQSGLKARVVLPDDGAYVISTFLPRSAARRQERGRFALLVQVDGRALALLPAARDAQVGASRYHATAEVRCRWAYATAAGPCEAGVVRRGPGGTATVDVHGPDGQRRRLLFVQGRLQASDSAWPVSSTRQGDVTTVELEGQERHELPDALLNGG